VSSSSIDDDGITRGKRSTTTFDAVHLNMVHTKVVARTGQLHTPGSIDVGSTKSDHSAKIHDATHDPVTSPNVISPAIWVNSLLGLTHSRQSANPGSGRSQQSGHQSVWYRTEPVEGKANYPYLRTRLSAYPKQSGSLATCSSTETHDTTIVSAS